MKKQTLLMAAVAVATITLAGCASNKPEAPINTTVVQPQEQSRQVYNIPLEKQTETSTTESKNSKNIPSETAELKTMAAPTLQQATAKVTLINKGDIIRAKIITTWNGHKQGYLKLHWIAPTKRCVSSSFPIMKYNDQKDYTWAEHTIDSKRCAGNWKAEVLTRDNTILSSASILVEKAQGSAQAKKQQLAPNAIATAPTAKAQMLPPKYLSVKNWKSCTSSKEIGTYSQVCLPKQKPTLCSQASWDALQKTKLRAC